jgi:hypothetical protein
LRRLFKDTPGDPVLAATAATSAAQDAVMLKTAQEDAKYYQDQFNLLVQALEAIQAPTFPATRFNQAMEADAQALGEMVRNLKGLDTTNALEIWNKGKSNPKERGGRQRSSYHPYAYRPTSLASSTSSDSASDY